MQAYTEHLAPFGDIVFPEPLYQSLKPICTPQDYQRALNTAEQLFPHVQSQDHPLFGVLTAILNNIEAYEDTTYPMNPATPAQVLEFLMEQNHINQSTLALGLGVHQSTISRLLKGKATLDTEILQKIADFFHVPPSAFFKPT